MRPLKIILILASVGTVCPPAEAESKAHQSWAFDACELILERVDPPADLLDDPLADPGRREDPDTVRGWRQ